LSVASDHGLRTKNMPKYDITVSCPVHDSFRVQQVAGMFDVPLAEKAVERFEVELPAESDDWQIGLIVGPSGSGKSTVAREAFGAAVYDAEGLGTGGWGLEPSADPASPSPWPSDRAVIDCFGDVPVRKVVELFTAVGFGSPPSWIKPYGVLSGGERFRCDLARALAVGVNRLVVFDEFTSVVDRTVAKVCSAAIAKGIRRGHIGCRFVAVTCHYDVAEWLEPDWVLDMATQELQRRLTKAMEGFVVRGPSSVATDHGPRTTDPWFRRPSIRLEIHRSRVEAWELFKRHHYLSAALAPQARCYLATWDGVPVHFCATLPVITKKNHRRFTRIVTLPDYQGLGIGMRCVAAVAELHRAEGLRVNVTSSHPALLAHCRRSPLWRTVNVKKSGTSRSASSRFPQYRSSAGRAVVSFEYVGP